MSMVEVEIPIPPFLKEKITVPTGATYQLLRPLTDYRSCHDGTPLEARMVFICALADSSTPQEELVIKIKVQLPGTNAVPHPGPSTTTAAELEALQIFSGAKTTFAPRLVAYHSGVQDDNGPLPGGFITYTVMTKLPGQSLFSRFWSMTTEERADIIPKTVAVLRSIYTLGVQPLDRGLRNVMWDAENKQCGIIDFELWSPVKEQFADEKTEMQQWGLIRTPTPRDRWGQPDPFVAFQAMFR